MKTAAALFSLGLLALAACVVNVPEPSPLDAGGDETVLGHLRAGRALYVNKCSGCHGLFSVERFSDREWTEHLREMVDLKKVRMLPDEQESLRLYLTGLNGRG